MRRLVRILATAAAAALVVPLLGVTTAGAD